MDGKDNVAELTIDSIISISERKLDVLNNKIVIGGSNIIRLDCSRKEGVVASFIKHSVIYSYKDNKCINKENNFTEIYLYRPPQKILLTA